MVESCLIYHYSILVHMNKTAGDYAIRLHSLRHEQVIQEAGIPRYPTAKVRSLTVDESHSDADNLHIGSVDDF